MKAKLRWSSHLQGGTGILFPLMLSREQCYLGSSGSHGVLESFLGCPMRSHGTSSFFTARNMGRSLHATGDLHLHVGVFVCDAVGVGDTSLQLCEGRHLDY